MKLIDDINGSLKLEVRVTSEAHEYFEAVFQSADLEKLSVFIKEALGEALKPPGKDVRFAKHVQKLVDKVGGLRREQTFYLKEGGDGEYTFAALWPWQSDPSKTTLKIGRGKFSSL